MKILLIGGVGFIGKRFIRRFSKSDQIIVVALRENIFQNKKLLDEHKIKTIECNVESEKLEEIILKRHSKLMSMAHIML